MGKELRRAYEEGGGKGASSAERDQNACVRRRRRRTKLKGTWGEAEEGGRRCVVSYPARGVGWYSGVVEKGKDAGGTDFTSAGIWGEQEKGGKEEAGVIYAERRKRRRKEP